MKITFNLPSQFSADCSNYTVVDHSIVSGIHSQTSYSTTTQRQNLLKFEMDLTPKKMIFKHDSFKSGWSIPLHHCLSMTSIRGGIRAVLEVTMEDVIISYQSIRYHPAASQVYSHWGRPRSREDQTTTISYGYRQGNEYGVSIIGTLYLFIMYSHCQKRSLLENFMMTFRQIWYDRLFKNASDTPIYFLLSSPVQLLKQNL